MFDLVSTFFLIGSAISANKFILYYLPATLFVGIRMIIAGPLIFIFNAIKHKNINIKKITDNIILILGAAIFTSYLPVIFKSFALQKLPSSQAAFLGTLDPFITAILSKLMFNTKLTKNNLLGMLIGALGVIILNINNIISLKLEFNYAQILAICAIIISRYGWILVQKLIKEQNITPEQISSITMTLGGILALLTSLFFENTTKISIPSSTIFYTLLTYTIAIGNMLGLTLYAYLLKKYSITYLSLCSFLVPLFVQILGWIFLNEPITINFFIALITTFIGVYIFNIKK